MSGAEEAANKGKHENIVSRLSRLQRAILEILATTPQPVGGNISKLPRTGDIIEALGRQKNPSNYAIFSRALLRLEERGLINSYASIFVARGGGLAYALREGEGNSGRGVAQFRLSRPKPRAKHGKTGDA